jgi:hypothetical protein
VRKHNYTKEKRIPALNIFLPQSKEKSLAIFLTRKSYLKVFTIATTRAELARGDGRKKEDESITDGRNPNFASTSKP